MYIPENRTDSDSIIVFSNNILSYDDQDLSFDRTIEVTYECLDISHDLHTLVAVVCQDGQDAVPEDEENFIDKCCTPHLSCDEEGDWIAPRRILHHDSHQMIGGVTVRPRVPGGDGPCPAGDRILSVPCQYVFTDGTFSAGEKTDRFPYICIDSREEPGGQQRLEARVCESDFSAENTEEVAVLSCLDPYLDTVRLVNTLSGTVSCIFLLITFLVYIKLPEFNNLHGKIVLSNIVSILLVTLYLSLVYHLPAFLTDLACQALGYLGYFFTISMFSWMTIMSFDLCWTFLTSSPPGSTPALVKFLSYSCLAWGGSGMLTASVLAMDLILPPTSTIRPAVGSTKCFLQAGAQAQARYYNIRLL